MKPSQRVLVGTLGVPTAIVVIISLLIPGIWNVPWLAISFFGVIWVVCGSAAATGGLAHEALRHMDGAAEPSMLILQHEVQKNGTVIAKLPDGSTREFRNWKAFWAASHDRVTPLALTKPKRDPRWANLRS